MKCKLCQEDIDIGDACRCEPIEPGSSRHVFYHCGCYLKVKEERQQDRRAIEDAKNEDEEFERIARQARTIC